MMAPQFDEGVLKYSLHPLFALPAEAFEPLRFPPREISVIADRTRAPHRRRCTLPCRVYARNVEVGLPSLA